MNIAQLQKRYQEADREAQNAFVLGDERLNDQWLDVRNAIGQILRERDYSAWKVLRPQRAAVTA